MTTAKTLFLYTRGTVGNPPEELRQLLEYMEHTTRANAKNEYLKEIQSMVETVKRDKGVSVGYMKSYEREEMLLNKGIQQGRKAERANTERERKRADLAEEENRRLKEEIEKLKKQSSFTRKEHPQ